MSKEVQSPKERGNIDPSIHKQKERGDIDPSIHKYKERGNIDPSIYKHMTAYIPDLGQEPQQKVASNERKSYKTDLKLQLQCVGVGLNLTPPPFYVLKRLLMS